MRSDEEFAERNQHRTKQTGALPQRAPVDLEDGALLEVMWAAKNGGSVQRLYHGDISGYPSHSEADLALCSHLVFWSGGDPSRVDSLFRGSDLLRPKWDERRGAQTYGERTIDTAFQGVSEFYTGHSDGQQPWRDRRGRLHLPRIEVEI